MARIKARRNSLSRILVIILSVILSIGAIFGVGAIVTSVEEETQKTISVFEFDQGVLKNGIYDNENKKGGVYTKEEFSCKGLEVEIDFENDIRYEIHFYDENGVYLFMESLDGNFSLNAKIEDNEDYTTVRKCRIVIIPDNDESVAFYEVQKYAKQLTIKVDKVQHFSTETKSETN